MEREHIAVDNSWVKTYQFKAQGGGSDNNPPPRDRVKHANSLRDQYNQAISESKRERNDLIIKEECRSKGTYMDVVVNKKSANLNSLDSKVGPRVMNIKPSIDKAEDVQATLFLPDKKEKWLNAKLDKYSDPSKDRKLPANGRLINSLSSIIVSKTESYFTLDEDRKKFENFTDDQEAYYEVWINTAFDAFDKQDIFNKLGTIGISKYSEECLELAEMSIVLIFSKKKNLRRISLVLDNLAELRLFRQASILLDANTSEALEWTELIKSICRKADNPVRVGVLDTGICYNHPLIEDYLPSNRCYSVTRNEDLLDKKNHGTLLGGLVLYGDLTDVIHNQHDVLMMSDLMSVNIYSETADVQDNDEQSVLYGVRMENAISHARDEEAGICCSAITVSEPTHGDPSSWSSAIDETLFHGGKPDTVLFVSAGNLHENNGAKSYPELNITSEVQDPAQSWNAVTVGAYTEKNLISNPEYKGFEPVAPKYGLCPYSTTSMTWDNGLIKPEIVMEGGNAIDLNGELSTIPDDLQLVSTRSISNKGVIRYFDTVNATSAASALAARLAAKIKYRNPNLSPLSIRALMVHSAEWNEVMKNQFHDDDKSKEIRSLLHIFGYGVPNEVKALASSDTYATFISEQVISPLAEKGPKCKFAQMHIYELPWPKELLNELGDQEVTMKLTLSYYIQPSPGIKSGFNKYKYPSLGLRFDVNTFTESEDEFINRVGHLAMGGVDKTKNDTKRWNIGIQNRNNGSIISDSITTQAANLASCNYIAVYPMTGWWKERKYREDRKINYSLVVSIESQEVEIYNAIQQKIAVQVAQ